MYIYLEMSQKVCGLKEIAHLYKNYFFDLDGVFWKGTEAVPGSFETLQYLRKQNKNIYFITNSSVNNRQSLQKKFTSFDCNVQTSQCFPSPYISSLYLKSKYPNIKKLMAFGSTNMVTQLQEQGFEVVHIKQFPQVANPIEIAQKYMDVSVDAILVGWDNQMTFSKQSLIGFYLQNGVKFFGTNPDRFTMIGGYKVPGAGSIIAAIETGSNIKAQIIGKPNTFILQHLIQTNNLKKEECLMIGDNIQTDILFGNNAGISTLCVLSGVTNIEELQDQHNLKAVPTFFSGNLWE